MKKLLKSLARQRRARRSSSEYSPNLHVETLEPRVLLAADLAADTYQIDADSVLTATGGAPVSAEILALQPLLYYRFDEATGALVANNLGSAGNAADLTLAGVATGVDGQINTAVQFDDPADNAEAVGYKAAPLAGANARTFMAWIKTDATNGTIVSYGTAALGQRMTLWVNAAGNLRVEVSGGGLDGNTVLTDGQWHHVAFTWDPADGNTINTGKLYVNGVAETLTAGAAQAVNTGTAEDLEIGHDWFATRPFVGEIDEVAAFTRALSAAEIASIYQSSTSQSVLANDFIETRELVNVSLGRNATQSSILGANPASNGVDGNPANFNHTNSGNDDPWWQVQLDGPEAISYIKLVTRAAWELRHDTFRISIWSGDPQNGGTEVWGWDYDRAVSGPIPYDFILDVESLNGSAVVGDYVRFQLLDANTTADNQEFVQIAEMSVWAYRTAPVLVNVAAGQSATQSSVYQNNVATYGPQTAVDGNLSNFNHTVVDTNVDHWWQVQLAQDESISQIVLRTRPGFQYRHYEFRISIWDGDPENGGTEIWGFDYDTDVSGNVPLKLVIDIEALNGGPVVGNYVRMDLPNYPDATTKNETIQIAELQVLAYRNLGIGTIETVTSGSQDPVPAGTPILTDQGGTLIVNADGSFSYDPNGAFDHLLPGETATETFEYTLTEPKPVIEVTFDETDGIPTDSVGGTPITVNSSPTSTSGLFGNALRLDGVDDYVDLDVSGAGLNAGSLSVSVWVRNLGGDWKDLWAFQTDAGSFAAEITSSGTMAGYVFGTVPGARSGSTSSQSVRGDRWQLVTYTFDAANQAARIYINGQLRAEVIWTATAAIQGMRIGNDYRNETRHISGSLDQFQVFDRALTATEIEHMAQLALEDGLVYYAPLDEANSATSDGSGSGITGLPGTGVTQGVDGRVGLAANFAAGNDGINLGQPDSLDDLSDNFSFSTWVKVDAYGGVQRFLSSDRSAGAFGWGVGLNGTAGLRFTSYGVLDYNVNVTLPAVDTWFQVGMVMSDADVTFYVNGEAVGTVAHGTPAGVNGGANNNWLIGRAGATGTGAPTEQFQGSLDELAVWDRTLSAADMQALYQAGLAEQSLLSSVALGNGLVYYAPLDEPTRATSDGSGSGITGLPGTGVTQGVDGQVDLGATFAAGNDGINLGQPNALDDLRDNFSFSTWVKVDAYGGVQRFLSSDRSAGNFGWGVGLNGTAGLRFTSYGVLDYNVNVALPATGTWFHVGMVMSDADVTFFVNGEAVGTVTHGTPAAVNAAANNNWLIGRSGATGTGNPLEHFQGTLDELAVWNRELSAADFRSLYQKGLAELNLLTPDPQTVTITIDGVDDPPTDLIFTVNDTSGQVVTSVLEGQTISVNGSFTDPDPQPVTLTVDWGNGDTSVIVLAAGERIFSVSYVYQDDYPAPLTVTVTVDDGTNTDTESTTLNVENAPTDLSGLSVTSVNEGGFAVLSGTVQDAGGNETIELTINWSDPSAPGSQTLTLGAAAINTAGVTWDPTTRQLTVTHQYFDDMPSGTSADTYSVIVIADDGTDVETVTLFSTVTNLPPEFTSVTLSSSAAVIGQPIQLEAILADAGRGANEPLSFTIDWGDGTVFSGMLGGSTSGANGSADQINTSYVAGTASSAASGSLTASHAYTALAPAAGFVITVTITDDDGGVITQTLTLGVQSAALINDPFSPGQQALAIGGTEGNDRFVLQQFADGSIRVLQGNGTFGAMTVVGTFNPDQRVFIFAGGGHDSVDASSVTRDVIMLGGDGNDSLLGGRGNDVIIGGAGNDLVNGGLGGNDIIIAGTGSDTLLDGTPIGAPADTDLLVSGSMDGETDLATLRDLYFTWTGGGMPSLASVSDDLTPDTIRSQRGEDSIAAGVGDTIVRPDGSVTVVDTPSSSSTEAPPIHNNPTAVITAAGQGGLVQVQNSTTGEVLWSRTYFANSQGTTVASGDVDGDGNDDVIIGSGSGVTAEIVVINGITGEEIARYQPFGGFQGGVFGAVGDIDHDGYADIIVGAGAGGGPHVKVISGQTGAELMSFFAYAPGFTGGVRVAAGDVDNDGHADVITAAGAGGGPHVRVISGQTGSELFGFFAYESGFAGGVFVASGDVNDDGHADIITGAGAGGGPHVQVFSGQDLTVLQSFFAYDPAFAGGVDVGATDSNMDGHADIITAAGPGGGPHVKVIDGDTGSTMASFFAFNPDFSGGVRVTAALGPTGSPLRSSLAATSGGSFVSSQMLAEAQLSALTLWQSAGISTEELTTLKSVPVVITDLPGELLGLSNPRRIWIDETAAGYGWGDDGFDLTTVLAHEYGHLLGRPDLDAIVDDLMAAELAPGTVRLPRVE